MNNPKFLLQFNSEPIKMGLMLSLAEWICLHNYLSWVRAQLRPNKAQDFDFIRRWKQAREPRLTQIRILQILQVFLVV